MSLTASSAKWQELHDGKSPEEVLGDIIEARLAAMTPEEADRAIERTIAIAVECRKRMAR